MVSRLSKLHLTYWTFRNLVHDRLGNIFQKVEDIMCQQHTCVILMTQCVMNEYESLSRRIRLKPESMCSLISNKTKIPKVYLRRQLPLPKWNRQFPNRTIKRLQGWHLLVLKRVNGPIHKRTNRVKGTRRRSDDNEGENSHPYTTIQLISSV